MNATPGFYFCICPDPALSREHIMDMFARESMSGLEREVRTWWADDGLDHRFWEALTLQGLTDKPQALVVRGSQTLPAEIWKKLSAALATPRTGILPVFFLESTWEKGQPKLPAAVAKLRCLEFAGAQGWIWRSPGLEPRAMRRHIQERGSALGLRFEADALDILCAVLAPDAAAVQGVLEQLLLAAPMGSPMADGTSCHVVSAALAHQMTAHTPEVLIFDFIRHLQDGNAAAVWDTLLREGDGGESLLFPLLSLLAREARILWQIQVGENVYIPQHIASAKKTLSARLGRNGLIRVFTDIMEAEWAVKSGRRQPLQALEELVADLTLVFGAGRVIRRG